MEVRGKAVTIREVEPYREQRRLARITLEDGHLGAGGKHRRGGSPRECCSLGMYGSGERERNQCREDESLRRREARHVHL